jgi:manganese transport protein
MLIVAGTVFYQHVNLANLSLQQAYITLAPGLGVFTAIAFSIGLLASGLSSFTTGTMAGQIVLRNDLMGELMNGRLTNIMNIFIVFIVTVLNVILLYTLLW